MMTIRNKDELLHSNNELKQCRICFDNNNSDDIISPCLCTGSSAYVHRKCLNDWRSQNVCGKNFKFCEICQFEYVIETILDDPKAKRKRLLKYYLFIIRDSIAIILLFQLGILILAFMLKTIDQNGELLKHLIPKSINGFMVYYLSTVILLLSFVGAVFLIISYCVAIFSGEGHMIIHSSSDLGMFNYDSGNRNSSQNNDQAELISALVPIILDCAFIGLFIGIVSSIIFVLSIMNHHTSKLWLRQEAEKYVVKDFQGQRKKLKNIRNLSQVYNDDIDQN